MAFDSGKVSNEIERSDPTTFSLIFDQLPSTPEPHPLLQFQPYQCIIEVTFWQKLCELKLDVWKLDNPWIPILGRPTHPAPTHTPSSFRLSDLSLPDERDMEYSSTYSSPNISNSQNKSHFQPTNVSYLKDTIETNTLNEATQGDISASKTFSVNPNLLRQNSVSSANYNAKSNNLTTSSVSTPTYDAYSNTDLRQNIQPNTLTSSLTANLKAAPISTYDKNKISASSKGEDLKTAPIPIHITPITDTFRQSNATSISSPDTHPENVTYSGPDTQPETFRENLNQTSDLTNFILPESYKNPPLFQKAFINIYKHDPSYTQGFLKNFNSRAEFDQVSRSHIVEQMLLRQFGDSTDIQGISEVDLISICNYIHKSNPPCTLSKVIHHINSFLIITYIDLKKFNITYSTCFPVLIPKNVHFTHLTPLAKLGDFLSQKMNSELLQDQFFALIKYTSSSPHISFWMEEVLGKVEFHELEKLPKGTITNSTFLCFIDPSSSPNYPSWALRSVLYIITLHYQLFEKSLNIILYRDSQSTINKKGLSRSLYFRVYLPPASSFPSLSENTPNTPLYNTQGIYEPYKKLIRQSENTTESNTQNKLSNGSRVEPIPRDSPDYPSAHFSNSFVNSSPLWKLNATEKQDDLTDKISNWSIKTDNSPPHTLLSDLSCSPAKSSTPNLLDSISYSLSYQSTNPSRIIPRHFNFSMDFVDYALDEINPSNELCRHIDDPTISPEELKCVTKDSGANLANSENSELSSPKPIQQTPHTEIFLSNFQLKASFVSGWLRCKNLKDPFRTTSIFCLSLQEFLSREVMKRNAVDLNIRLIKWRILPEFCPDNIQKKRFLLLGAGALGSCVARTLVAWGCRKLTIVDRGRVALSNPSRQWLYTHKDADADSYLGKFKAEAAKEHLLNIRPDLECNTFNLEIPMPGHPISVHNHTFNEAYETLENLIDTHDVVFLLTDSRESRWLPSLMIATRHKPQTPKQKAAPLCMTVAIGFDSFVVMRHSFSTTPLACYFCNDFSAPSDSVTDRTLDQQCTITRPGAAIIASTIAVELVTSLTQHTLGFAAPHSQAYSQQSLLAPPSFYQSCLGATPHTIRGFLNDFRVVSMHTEPFENCICCSPQVIDHFQRHGKEFVQKVVLDSTILEQVSGLDKIKEAIDEDQVIALSDNEDDYSAFI